LLVCANVSNMNLWVFVSEYSEYLIREGLPDQFHVLEIKNDFFKSFKPGK